MAKKSKSTTKKKAQKAAPSAAKNSAVKSAASAKGDVSENSGEPKTTKSAKKRRPVRKGSLVIVESPAKARTIEKYLGKGFTVMASVGHVIDLPTSTLGVDLEGNYAPQYEVIKGKKTIIDNLRKAARKAERVYLAPDPDREGEAIAYHIANAIGGDEVEIHRAVFNEITREAVRRAIENPTVIDTNLFNAQQARRILDRLVGYKISPLLWTKVRRGLSAGRVQSVALRLIVDRDREVKAFDPVEYWTIGANANAEEPPPFRIRLAKIDGKDPEIGSEEATNKILNDVKGKPFVVQKITKRQVAKRPFPPFITSTLQQEGSRKLRYTARRTMRIAQKLYEGIEIGVEGPQGLITYMRTDSTRLAPSALDNIRGYIHKNFDAEYLPGNARFYSKGKGAQDAHEAVRPTDINLTPARVAKYLNKDELALYTLIWNRTVASQMVDAKLERTRIETPIDRYLFIATGSVVAFPGFLKIYEEATDEAGKTESDAEGEEKLAQAGDERLPRVSEGQTLKIEDLAGKQHFTQPPPRFTEAGLIKELEHQGIGRPSTYAAIISTIQDREYVEKEGGSFRATELGFIITDLLTKSFPQVLDVKFTARMEGQLDQVEEGKVDWVELLDTFYKPFAERLEIAKKEMRNLKAEVTPTEFKCDKCDSPMVVRWGRRGKFLACSAYPDCRNTKPIVIAEDGTVEIQKEEVTGHHCVNCGKPMVIKNGRRGRFMACSGYPDCKTSKPIPIGVACPRPGCKGELVERMSGRGGTFYSCNAYPDCRYLVGTLPVATPCEVCNKERLVAGKGPRAKVFGCTREDCAYQPAYGARDEKRQSEPLKPRASKDDKAAKKTTAAKKKAPKKKARKKAKKTAKKKAVAKKAPAKKAPSAKAD